jgi:hypothetical protein
MMNSNTFGGNAVKRSVWGWMLCCTLLSATLAFGQSATTSLRGTVKDPSGALVPGAKITLADKAKGMTLNATADNAGNYIFAQIPPARYTITVSATGFGNQSKTAELLVNQPATINFALTVEASSITVDVSATAQTLNTADATMGDSVGNQTIAALPMEGRDPISLLTLQPGVLYLGNPEENSTNDSRSGSVNGGRSDQGNITLDGMDDNDQLTGTAFTGVLRSTMDSTEEFRVTTSNGTADAGRSSGAQVALVTKGGTNVFHGALYEYYRPTNTVANNWFNKSQQLSQGLPNRPQKYVLNTFGGSIGGPIKKDKLFFFFNYEGLRQAISDVVTATVPTAQFYLGQLGYINNSGTTSYLTSTQVGTLDAGCTSNVACGVNPNVQTYFSSLKTAGIIGTSGSAGDAINSAGYVFPSPAPKTQNTSIVKLDYVLTGHQQIFVRGNLQKDTRSGDENLPGEPANYRLVDNTKGIAAGHTWTPNSNMVNDLRYGFIRQGYATRGSGSGQGDWVNFRFLTQPQGHTLSSIVNVPVHNITDTFTWTKGTHTMSFGGNWTGIWNNRSSDGNSYSNASTDPYWMYDFPNTPNDLIADHSFDNSYEIAYATLMGTVPLTNKQYNYTVGSGNVGTQLIDGAFLNRHFHSNEFEYFLQDSWRIRQNLTVTFGMRHSILQTPYETNGQQVSPTVDTDAWFQKRGAAAATGLAFEDPLSFAPSGKANHKPGYWAKQKANIAPRLAITFSPDPKTSFRIGAGMYFDHFGEGIVDSFDQNGSFGLTTTVSSPASYYGFENSPRFTGAHNVPALAGSCSNPTTITYPFTPANNTDCGFAITWGIDNKLKTPYSYNFDMSFQHEFPGGFIFEEAYVGRMGRHLLEQLDLAEPVNLADPKGGGTYFKAAAELSRISDLHGGDPNAQVQPIPYFEDMFPYMANIDYSPESATQAIYSDEWTQTRYGAGETQALLDIDYANPNGMQFWNQQFSSLYAWASIGTSSYNALQFTLRHPYSHGLTVDAGYTLSKSIDMGSAVERANWESSDAFGGTGIQNTWNPKANKGVSDFDSRHLVTIDWVYALPVGRGKSALHDVNRVADAFIGGWQWSGLSRWSSGLPFSLYEPGWSTDWNEEGQGVVTGNVKVRKHIDASGTPQVFDDPGAINSGVATGSPVRLPYPGENGSRNYFRGDGYFDIDSSLSKTWKLHDTMALKFAAEVYNVPNNVRFDDSPINLNGGLTSGTLGAYGGVLTTYRRMQFGLRLDY